MTDEAEFERIDLEKFQVVLFTEVSKELLEEFAEPPNVALSVFSKWCADIITMRIKQDVYGETLGTLEIQRPATWFQMLKEQHAPYWFKRRWPVRYTTETYDARALYPKLHMQDEEHNYVWVQTYRAAHTEPKGS